MKSGGDGDGSEHGGDRDGHDGEGDGRDVGAEKEADEDNEPPDIEEGQSDDSIANREQQQRTPTGITGEETTFPMVISSTAVSANPAMQPIPTPRTCRNNLRTASRTYRGASRG